MRTRSDELEDFKTRINLTEYAAAQGYELNRKKSHGSSILMRSGSDIVVIGKNAANGHWIYWQVDSGVGEPGSDAGSIIDFVQHRKGGTLGAVRKELRPWLGGNLLPCRPNKNTYVADLKPTTKDRMRVLALFETTTAVSSHPFLEEERCVPRDVVAHGRFADRVRIDHRGNAIFPHFDQNGLCGFEIKNKDFTSFSAGGEKGLWCSQIEEGDTTLVIAETAIDGLSHFTLKRPSDARYVSIGGAMNPNQLDLVKAAIEKMPPGSQIVTALDNDQGGGILFGRIETIFRDLEARECVLIDERPPTTGQDWNDALRASVGEEQSFPPPMPEA